MGKQSREANVGLVDSEVPSETSWKHFILLAAGALLIITVVMYWPLLTGRIPFPAYTVQFFPPWDSVRTVDMKPPRVAEVGDLTTLLYPWRELTHRSIRAGDFPLWNPHYQMGLPFFAEPQSALLYPPHILFAMLPLAAAWGLSFPLRVIMAGLFTALFARAMRCSRTGSLAAGIAYALCAAVTAFNGRPQLDAALWVPLILLSVHRLQTVPRFSSAVLAAIAFSLSVLAGHPENALHAVLVGCLFALWRAAFPADESSVTRARFLRLFTVAGLLAIAFTAVQVGPTLEWLGQINRGLDAVWGPRPLSELAGFFSRDSGSNPNAGGVMLPEGANYVGIVTMILVPFAFVSKQLRDRWFLLGIAVLSFGISYGIDPFWWLSLQIPVLKGIPNHRLLIVMAFCFAILAGAGLTWFQRMGSSGLRRARLAMAMAAGSATLGVLILWLREVPDTALPVPWRGSAMSSIVVLILALLVLAAGVSGLINGRRVALLAVLLLSLDLITASWGFIPFHKPSDVFPPNPAFDFLQKSDPSRYRAGSVDVTFGTNYELVYGLFAPGGFDLPLTRASAILDRVTQGGDAVGLRSDKILGENSRILDVMNVKYFVTTTWNDSAAALGSVPSRFRLVFSEGSIRIYESLSVLPRAFFVPATGVEVIPSEEKQLERLLDPAFDPSRQVILSEPLVSSMLVSGGSSVAARPSVVGAIEHTVNRVSVELEAGEPGFLVLSQMHYPGWQVRVNGETRPLLRADYAFSAVPVASGRHQVEFVFRPTSVLVGASISIVAVLGSLVGVYLERSRRRTSLVLTAIE